MKSKRALGADKFLDMTIALRGVLLDTLLDECNRHYRLIDKVNSVDKLLMLFWTTLLKSQFILMFKYL
ncbi:MAG: hypothetical protein LBD73_08630 [Deferribacteraceae bacterium]|nr:hypothetical protein [Deferribacteraceae bacterium]